jgi:hypothetical protein
MSQIPAFRSILAILTGIVVFGLCYGALLMGYYSLAISLDHTNATLARVNLLILFPLSLFIGAIVTGIITSLEGWWLCMVWAIPVMMWGLALYAKLVIAIPGLLAIMITWMLIAGILGGNLGGAIGRLFRETGGGLPREVLRGPQEPGVGP